MNSTTRQCPPRCGWVWIACCSYFTWLAMPAAGTVVKLDTVEGDIFVDLFEEQTPATVANFLNHATSGRYDNSFFHRSVPGFVLQGGGFVVSQVDPLAVDNVPTDAPVPNEPGISNLRGTIAMAKLGGNPDSATSQWFFNLDDNSQNLDNQNGGFTVFGEVLGNSMQVVDAMAAYPTFPFNSPFSEIPLRDYTTEDFLSCGQSPLGVCPNGNHTLMVRGIDLLPDFNADDRIDELDRIVLSNNLGLQNGATLADGDGDGDGDVDGDDFLHWQRYLGYTVPTSATAAAATAVPEPRAALLFGAGLLLMLCWRGTLRSSVDSVIARSSPS